MINETYSAFVQGFMPNLARSDVDVLEGLTTAILVDQEQMGANAGDPDAEFAFGLERVLDGVDALVRTRS